ncbi:MAG: SAM-dependent methyltransferase [Rubrivivax sp.]|jgi:16S rRNA (cytidine1402-2'-O)-methyltransferase|nr:SAM-dependent methyltransferase [Rubrivivax sp.]
MSANPGTLWLVPAPLDLGASEAPLDAVLPQAALARAATLQHWVVEDAKSARALLKRVGQIVPLAQPLQALQMHELPRPPKGGPRQIAPAIDWAALLAPALQGHDMGLLSEAGLPAVADPGSALVAAAHDAGVPVQPLSGPSSLMLALAASGLNGQSFAFVGYLPQEAGPRTARIQALEALSRQQQQTQIAIETPYRNTALLQALVQALQPGTRLSVSCGLTLEGGFTRSAPVSAWRREPTVLPDKLPAVFSWLAR